MDGTPAFPPAPPLTQLGRGLPLPPVSPSDGPNRRAYSFLIISRARTTDLVVGLHGPHH